MKYASALAIVVATMCSTGCGDPAGGTPNYMLLDTVPWMDMPEIREAVKELRQSLPYDSIQLRDHGYSITVRRDGSGSYWGGRCARVKGGWESENLLWNYIRLLHFMDELNIIGHLNEYTPSLPDHASPYRILVWERGRADPLEYTGIWSDESVETWALRGTVAGLLLSPFWKRVPQLSPQAEDSITALVNAFWLAAGTGDSTALDSLVASPQPLEWVRNWQGHYPQFFERTAGHLDVGPLYPRTTPTDSVLAVIRVPWVWSPHVHQPREEMDVINVGVLSYSGSWRIVTVGRKVCSSAKL